MKSISRLSVAIASLLLAAAVLAAPAGAACGYTGAKQVFKPWGDQRHYVLAPDGGFESGASGWSLKGASVVAGNESFFLNAAGDSSSLSLPAGSSAGSPPVCVSLDTPVFRAVVRNAGDPSSRLRIESIYKLLGLVRTNVVKTVSAGSAWAPTPAISPVLGLSTLVGTILPSAIQIRFTPADNLGDWQVDDLFIDPFARH